MYKNSGSKKRSESAEEEEEVAGPSTRSTPSKRKKLQKLSYSSPISNGVKEDIWTLPLYKEVLPVTCGNKNGSLYRDKLAKGEECILAEGRWFNPKAFEEFGGKKSSKKWKMSICCQDTPLQKLIKEGHLKCPRSFSQQSLSSQSKQGSRSGSSSDSERPAQSREKRRTTSSHPRQSEHNISESGTDFKEEEEEEEEEENDQEAVGNGDEECHGDVDKPEFLSVTCGSATGTLQKDRFASGTSGKCIRTASKWLTPVEFAREDPVLANSSWKKSILCQGIPISDLIERRVLIPHSLLCRCRLCSKNKKDLMEQENDDYCAVCVGRGSLLCCDGCPRAFHTGCHLPTVDEGTLGERWLCTYCILAACQRKRNVCNQSLTQALKSHISDFMLECQYLLLQLYNADKDHIFFFDPCDTVPGYRDVIEDPMWLNKVKEKLQDRQYSSVRQFVSDIYLIFENCSTFNRDDEFGQTGARLRQLFDEEFQHVFSVKN